MVSKKTSKKQDLIFLKDLPITKLKPGIETRLHDPAKNLKDKEFIYKALLECLIAGDKEAFMEIIDSHYEALNKVKVLKELNLSRRTYYAAIKEGSNPSFDTIMKLLKGISKAS